MEDHVAWGMYVDHLEVLAGQFERTGGRCSAGKDLATREKSRLCVRAGYVIDDACSRGWLPSLDNIIPQGRAIGDESQPIQVREEQAEKLIRDIVGSLLPEKKEPTCDDYAMFLSWAVDEIKNVVFRS